MAPVVGLKPEIVGVGNTVKLGMLVMVTPLTVISILPVVAPFGTVVVRLVGVEAVTTEATPLKVTTLFEGVVLKLVPVIVTEALIEPLVGLKLVIVGVGNTVKSLELEIEIPFTLT